MTSIQAPLLWGIFGTSLISVLLAGIALKRNNAVKGASALSVLIIVATAVLLIVRARLAHALPLANGIDFSIWLVLVLNLFSIFLVRKGRLYAAALLIHLINAGLCLWMLSLSLHVTPPMPALRSPWLAVHVMTAMLSYSCLCVSFVLALLLLIKGEKNDVLGYESETAKLDDWSYRLVLIGLPLLTVMLITGSVWAEYSWGSYWSWDWKETWALITWLVYALYLHLRVSGWRNRKAAVLNLIGFGVVVFTFFGVSYLLPGLHSYLNPMS